MVNLSTLLWILIIISFLSPMIQRQVTNYQRLRAIRRLEERRHSRVITLSTGRNRWRCSGCRCRDTSI